MGTVNLVSKSLYLVIYSITKILQVKEITQKICKHLWKKLCNINEMLPKCYRVIQNCEINKRLFVCISKLLSIVDRYISNYN